MTRMTPLLERNEQFARTYTPAALGIPAAHIAVVAQWWSIEDIAPRGTYA